MPRRKSIRKSVRSRSRRDYSKDMPEEGAFLDI
jgi:hypothetical protein